MFSEFCFWLVVACDLHAILLHVHIPMLGFSNTPFLFGLFVVNTPKIYIVYLTLLGRP